MHGLCGVANYEAKTTGYDSSSKRNPTFIVTW